MYECACGHRSNARFQYLHYAFRLKITHFSVGSYELISCGFSPRIRRHSLHIITKEHENDETGDGEGERDGDTSSEDEVTPVAHEGNPSDEGRENSSGEGVELDSTLQEGRGQGSCSEFGDITKAACVDSVPTLALEKKITSRRLM